MVTYLSGLDDVVGRLIFAFGACVTVHFLVRELFAVTAADYFARLCSGLSFLVAFRCFFFFIWSSIVMGTYRGWSIFWVVSL